MGFFGGCRVVLNFYPVKANDGLYSPTGAFRIYRNTAGQLAGFTLAPKGIAACKLMHFK